MSESYLPQAGETPELVRITEQTQPGYTYRLDIERACLRGMTDNRDAVAQAVFLMLSVERYRYPIYSRNYGVELEALIGQPKDYVMTEAKRRITEALLQDNRITEVGEWRFELAQSSVTATFIVRTIYGEIEVKKEVAD